MKRMFTCLFIIIAAGVFAQDLIILKDGNIIESKVTEISPTEIRYKRFNHLDGPTIVLPIANVLSIRYENGMTEIINANTQSLAETSAITETTPDTNAAQYTDIYPLAETTVVPSADIHSSSDTEPIFMPKPIAAPAIRQKESIQDRNPKLNTLGLSLGYLGISDFGISANGTASPAPNTFFGFNIEFGFMPFSFNGNANFNGFVPFNKGGWYIGLGLGGGVYEAAEKRIGFFDINAVTGFIFFDWLNISFTLQMELVPEFNINVKPMIGYVYRFTPHPEPVQPVAETAQPVVEPVRQTQRTAPEVKPDFILINGGTFIMGGNKYARERPEHLVTVKSFYMGKYEITQKEYQEIMGANPSRFIGDNRPVERVNWFDAVEYCNRRSLKEGLIPAYVINYSDTGISVGWNRNANGYRLPTEAEWEYACRAGTISDFNTGMSSSKQQANYYTRQTIIVGSYDPNPWGLYDMHGNVWEWCWDWFAAGYQKNEQVDPIGENFGSKRVARGGSYRYKSPYARSAYRYAYNPIHREIDIGFRLVRP